MTSGIGIGTRYRYQSWPKVSVSVVSVNPGIGLTLVAIPASPVFHPGWDVQAHTTCVMGTSGNSDDIATSSCTLSQ